MSPFFHSFWYRIGYPVLASIYGFAFSFVFVPTSNLVLCEGKPRFFSAQSYRSGDENRLWRYFIGNHQIHFSIENCRNTSFEIQSIGLDNPIGDIGAILATYPKCKVWFVPAQGEDQSNRLPLRIEVDGKPVFDAWDIIHAWGIVTYPMVPLGIIWLFSLYGLIRSPKNQTGFEMESRLSKTSNNRLTES